jgi:hypothetical protein
MDLGERGESFHIPLVDLGESFHVPFMDPGESFVPPDLFPASSLTSGIISLGELCRLRCIPFRASCIL